MTRLFRCLLLPAAGLLLTRTTQAYVTSFHAVPAQRHMAWLKQMSQELTSAKPGELSRDQLQVAPEVMYALAHSRQSSKEHALILESLVKRLIDEQRAGNQAATDLTVEDYNNLLEGWARSGESLAAAERCEQILTAMHQHEHVQPNLSSFKAVLMAWRQAADCSYAPFRAQRILELMINLHEKGGNEEAFPDADCVDICLQTWSRSGHPEAPQRTEQLLLIMERLYESTQLERIKPRVTSFNAVLAALAKSGRPEHAERAADILFFLERLSKDDPTAARPDAASYCTVLAALARFSHIDPEAAASKASLFLEHALEMAQESTDGEANLVVDTILFNTAMGLWSKSSIPGAYRKASSILQQQRQLSFEEGYENCRPDVFGYTSVLASCASVPEGRAFMNAWKVAVKTYGQLRAEDKANHVSYGTMLKACVRLLEKHPKERRAWTRKIFGHAVAAGCVNDLVLQRLERGVGGKAYRELLQGHHPNHLPAEWTANVNQQSRTKGYRQRRSRRRAEV